MGTALQPCIALKEVMADSMVFDALVEDEGLRRATVALTQLGKLRIYTTHIQEDELAGIGDHDKMWRVKSVPREIIPTSDFIAGVSRVGLARVGSGRAYELIRSGHRHIDDAAIAATTEREGLTLVTGDRRLTNQSSSKLKISVWPLDRFLAWVRQEGLQTVELAERFKA